MSGMEELKVIFFEECSELLLDLETRLLNIEEETEDKETLNAIFRCAHSIKGGSGAFGMDAIMKFTHTMEALLDKMREGKIPATRDIIDVLLKSTDIVGQMLALEKSGQSASLDIATDLKLKLEEITNSAEENTDFSKKQTKEISEEKKSKTTCYFITLKKCQDIFKTANEPLLIFQELQKLGKVLITCNSSEVPSISNYNPEICYLSWEINIETEQPLSEIKEIFEFINDSCEVEINEVQEPESASEVIPNLVENTSEQNQEKLTVSQKAPVASDESEKAKLSASIRVDIEKVDKLVNMVGELVITEAMIKAQTINLDEKHAGLLRGIAELSHHTRELQEAVMAVRMQPIKSVFSRMPRIVRDTAAQLGKNIRIILNGENTEVDKNVIEKIGDPLTHMIRNACDHGVEMPDKRISNGKNAQGTINLSAYHRSGRIIIEISDDGAGINRKKVLEKAKEKGLIKADDKLSDEEIDQLIFLPGFSTAEKVTNVSGRGVGTDVVKKNIESLGGYINITNNPGKGSIFTVSLPLTLAILDGMTVSVGKEIYIIPISNIIETLRPKKSEIHKVQGKSDVMDVRGEFIPIVYLHKIFDIKNSTLDPSKALVVIVESSKSKVGIVVDELVGQQQVVIKSLDANSDPVKGISGATILGNGRVALILEINELWYLHQNMFLKNSNVDLGVVNE